MLPSTLRHQHKIIENLSSTCNWIAGACRQTTSLIRSSGASHMGNKSYCPRCCSEFQPWALTMNLDASRSHRSIKFELTIQELIHQQISENTNTLFHGYGGLNISHDDGELLSTHPSRYLQSNIKCRPMVQAENSN